MGKGLRFRKNSSHSNVVDSRGPNYHLQYLSVCGSLRNLVEPVVSAGALESNSGLQAQLIKHVGSPYFSG